MEPLLYLFCIVILASTANANNDTSTNDMYVDRNHVIISTKVFTMLIAVGAGALLCCGFALLCCCIAMCYYYKTKIRGGKVKDEIEVGQHQRLQSPSVISVASSIGDSKYTQSDDNTTDTKSSSNTKWSKSIQLTLPQRANKPQLKSLSHAEDPSIDKLKHMAEQQKKVTAKGGVIRDTNHNIKIIKCEYKEDAYAHSKHRTFDSEELYIDHSDLHTTPRDDEEHDEQVLSNMNITMKDSETEPRAERSDSSSTLTLPTLVSGVEGSARKPETSLQLCENAIETEPESYTVDGHRRNVLSRSEGHKRTTDGDIQYSIHEQIPSITEVSLFDMDMDDDCKTIHHQTVKRHRNERKKKSKRKDHSNALAEIDTNRSGVTPFTARHGPRYHTQPNLKYIPKHVFMQHPPYLSVSRSMNSQKTDVSASFVRSDNT
eukprot:272630_1